MEIMSRLRDGSLTYTCDLDGNTVQKTYPRAGYDYPSGRWYQVSNVDLQIHLILMVGPSTYTGAITFVSASANGLDRTDRNYG